MLLHLPSSSFTKQEILIKQEDAKRYASKYPDDKNEYYTKKNRNMYCSVLKYMVCAQD